MLGDRIGSRAPEHWLVRGIQPAPVVREPEDRLDVRPGGAPDPECRAHCHMMLPSLRAGAAPALRARSLAGPESGGAETGC